MSKQFGSVLQRNLAAAYEQGVRDGTHQTIIQMRKQRAEKSLRGKLKRLVKR